MPDRIVRTASPQASAILEAVADAKRRSLRLPEDEEWLREQVEEKLAPRKLEGKLAPLLQGMADRKSVYRVRRGRYVVAPRGSFSVKQAASTELFVDLVLGAQGDYYLSYLSALVAHRLTDVHSTAAYAAIRQSSGFRDTHLELPGVELHIVRLSEGRWPTEERELERVRIFPDAKEFVWRASLERTLVDALSRPQLSAGFETVMSCWAVASKREVNWDLVAAIGERAGDSTARRTAFLLGLLGYGDVVERNFATLGGRGRTVPLDRTNSYRLAHAERDSRTGVVVNVPVDHLRGWVAAAANG